jgi:hypothetical protein
LGFTDRKRTNAGYILWLGLRTHKRIHKLADDHEIGKEPWFTEKGFRANCPICEELADSSRSSAELKRDAGNKPSEKWDNPAIEEKDFRRRKGRAGFRDLS